MNLSCSCFQKTPFRLNRQVTIALSFIPVLSFHVLQRYRKKNVVAYVARTIELLDRRIEFTEKQILAKHSATLCPYKQKNAKLKWTSSVIDWVELIYALHTVDYANGGRASLKKMFDYLGDIFDIEVKEFSRIFIDVKSRVKNRTSFLDKLKRVLIERIEKSDGK